MGWIQLPNFIQHCKIPSMGKIFGIRSYLSNKNYIYILDGMGTEDYFIAISVHTGELSWTSNRNLDRKIDGVDII